jgi:hypothetical protein
MPGEPFGMAQTEDGTAIAITHQTDTKTSLFTTGSGPPAIQFVLNNVAVGGNGIAAVPHDPDAFATCPSGLLCAPRPAFWQTSRNVAEVDLLRFYSDEEGSVSSSLNRPFLVREETFPLTANAGGTDSRGIAFDPTPRIACKARIAMNDANAAAEREACARLPARAFIANRTPASLILGEVGEPTGRGDGSYNEDALAVFGSVPLSVGPSRVYVAPIVDKDGNYSLRVFVVCFDAQQIYVYDPDAAAVEAIIPMGLGPFAMAFDPFDINDVALHKGVPQDVRDANLNLKKYRFAYVASFTDSFVQIIDLDNSLADKSTFETVVYTLGSPKVPKGQQ